MAVSTMIWWTRLSRSTCAKIHPLAPVADLSILAWLSERPIMMPDNLGNSPSSTNRMSNWVSLLTALKHSPHSMEDAKIRNPFGEGNGFQVKLSTIIAVTAAQLLACVSLEIGSPFERHSRRTVAAGELH